jgi:heme A synthase
MAGSILTFLLVVIGGVVRITGSGMGCGDHWPRCDGEWFPPLDLPTFIEISHRWIAALVSVATAGAAMVAWRRHRTDRRLVTPAILAAILLVIQILLGAVTVKLELPPSVVIVHLLNAMLVLGALLWTGLEARIGPTTLSRSGRAPLRWALAYAAFGLVVILWGAQVANLNAGMVCTGFPLCAGAGLGPPPTALGPLHWTHRILAYAFLAASVVALFRFHAASAPAAVWRAALAVTLATTAQVAVAAAMVLLSLPTAFRALHLGVGTAVWVTLVVLVHRVARSPWPERAATRRSLEGAAATT